MGETLEDMENTVLMEDLVPLAFCLGPVSLDFKEEIITREGLLGGTVREAASMMDQDHQQLEMMDPALGMEEEVIIKSALEDLLDNEVVIMEYRQQLWRKFCH